MRLPLRWSRLTSINIINIDLLVKSKLAWYRKMILLYQFSSVQSLSRVWLFVTPWVAAHQASLSITNSWSTPKLMCIESVMPSSHLILCRPLILPPIPPSIRVISNESTLHMRWPMYWSFSFSIIPSKEHPGLPLIKYDFVLYFFLIWEAFMC